MYGKTFEKVNGGIFETIPAEISEVIPENISNRAAGAFSLISQEIKKNSWKYFQKRKMLRKKSAEVHERTFKEIPC